MGESSPLSRTAVTRSGIGLQPFSRRAFLGKAAILAAGSALGTPLISCGETEIVVPCLGPAPPPTPVPGMTYIRASEIGCALDCDLNSGRNKKTGGPATDDAPRINAAMAGATPDHPITLIIDGSALISGLYMPAAGHWAIAGLGCGTGFFIQSGSNSDGIHNGPRGAGIPNDQGPPAPPRGQNVSLSNFAINGNAGDGHNGDSTNGKRQGGWYFCVNLMNLDNISVEKVVAVNSPAFLFRFVNCGHVKVSGCVMEAPYIFNDGLHFDGPANDVTITDCKFSTGDDSIAFNCPEGNGGDISNVTIANCDCHSLSLLRLYTTAGGPRFRIRNVSVTNCTGVLTEYAFVFGLANGSLPDSIDNVTIADCNLTAPVLLGIAENFGSVAVKNVAFTPNPETVFWTGPQVNHDCAFLRPAPPYGGVSWIGSQLTVTNCTINRDQGSPFTPFLLASNSRIENLQFDGFAVRNAGNRPALPQMIDIASGGIGNLVIDSLTSDTMLAPVGPSQWSSVGKVTGQGTGVLATNWRIPDTVMADHVPFLSATTGLPSIKIDGFVQPYKP